MALEPITRQERIIAGKDLEPITRMEKFLKEYGGGGGASSWNDLDDRPFGEETVYGDTLTWDGNTEGLECIDMMGDGSTLFIHVSEATPTAESMSNGGAISCKINGESTVANFTSANVMQMYDGISAIMLSNMPYAMIVHESAVGVDNDGLCFTKSGIWLYYSAPANISVQSLTINGYNGFETKVVKPIDNKYLEPFETVGGDTLTWDGNTEGLESAMGILYRVSDVLPSEADFANGFKVTSLIAGETATTEYTSADVTVQGSVIACPNLEFVIVPADNTEVSGANIEKKGLYFMNDETYGQTTYSLTINGYTGFITTKLKEEYLPEQSGGGGSMVVTITETDTQKYISDKTFAEIEKAINDGKNVTVRTILPNGACMYYKLVIHQSGLVVGFDLVQYVAYTKELQILMFVISADNNVTMQITALKMEE